MTKKLKVMLVDDLDLVRQGLRALLEAGTTASDPGGIPEQAPNVIG